jgi:hypothetical protein
MPFWYFINDGDGDEWNIYRLIAPSGRMQHQMVRDRGH